MAPTNCRIVKRAIVRKLSEGENMMISALADSCGFSVPTITKYINELLNENLVMPSGKIIQSRGKHPAVYKINPNSRYFAGIDIKRDSLRLAIINLSGDTIKEEVISDYHFSNSLPYFEDMKNKVLTFLDSTPPSLKNTIFPISVSTYSAESIHRQEPVTVFSILKEWICHSLKCLRKS